MGPSACGVPIHRNVHSHVVAWYCTLFLFDRAYFRPTRCDKYEAGGSLKAANHPCEGSLIGLCWEMFSPTPPQLSTWWLIEHFPLSLDRMVQVWLSREFVCWSLHRLLSSLKGVAGRCYLLHFACQKKVDSWSLCKAPISKVLNLQATKKGWQPSCSVCDGLQCWSATSAKGSCISLGFLAWVYWKISMPQCRIQLPSCTANRFALHIYIYNMHVCIVCMHIRIYIHIFCMYIAYHIYVYMYCTYIYICYTSAVKGLLMTCLLFPCSLSSFNEFLQESYMNEIKHSTLLD